MFRPLDILRELRDDEKLTANEKLVLICAAPAFADASTSTRTTLVLMHVTVAAVLIPGLRRTARS